MKKVNFITSLSPQKQYEISRWFWVTILLFVCGIILGVYFLYAPYRDYLALKRDVSTLREKTIMYDEKSKNRNIHESERELLRKHVTKVDGYNTAPKNPYLYIQTIMQACDKEVRCESIRFNKKNCDIIMSCLTPEHATMFITRLTASGLFSGVKLTALQHDTQTKQFSCTIKSTIIVES